MKIKSINRLILILNAFSILLIIGTILWFNYYKVEFFHKYEIINANSSSIAMLEKIILFLNLAISLILAILNKGNRKISISYLIIAIPIIMLIINYIFSRTIILDYICIFLYIVIIIFQLVFLHKQREDNNKKVLTTIIAIFYCLLLIGIILFYVFYSYKIMKEAIYDPNKYKQDILKEISNTFPEYTGEEYIQVYNNDKYGYINKKGELEIPCIYEKSLPYIFIINIDKKQYQIILAIEKDECFIISKGNKRISLGEEPLEWVASQKVETKLQLNEQKLRKMMLLFASNIPNNNEIENHHDLLEPSKDKDEYEYFYEFENFSIGVREFYSNNMEVTIEKNEGKETYKERIATTILGNILLYSDGYIPFYNKEKNIQGWYDKQGNKKEIIGNYEILDVKNNIMTIIDLDKDEKYFINVLDNKVLLKAKEISILRDGYIVKLLTDKYVYINNNLDVLSEEYDYMYSNNTIDTTYWYLEN